MHCIDVIKVHKVLCYQFPVSWATAEIRATRQAVTSRQFENSCDFGKIYSRYLWLVCCVSQLESQWLVNSEQELSEGRWGERGYSNPWQLVMQWAGEPHLTKNTNISPCCWGGGVGATHVVVAPVFFSTKCRTWVYKMGCLETLSTKSGPWIGFFTTKWVPKKVKTGIWFCFSSSRWFSKVVFTCF